MKLHKIRIAIYLITAWAMLASCSVEPELANIKLDESNPRLVVEGLITDQPGPYFVQLSLTTSYYNKGEAPKINNAIVTNTDNAGHSEVLSRVESQDGLYQTQTLQGEV